jgi:hypothetical protein
VLKPYNHYRALVAARRVQESGIFRPKAKKPITDYKKASGLPEGVAELRPSSATRDRGTPRPAWNPAFAPPDRADGEQPARCFRGDANDPVLLDDVRATGHLGVSADGATKMLVSTALMSTTPRAPWLH